MGLGWQTLVGCRTRAKRKQSVNALPLNTVSCRPETLWAEVGGETKKAWEQPKKSANNGHNLLRTAGMTDEESRAVCFVRGELCKR